MKNIVIGGSRFSQMSQKSLNKLLDHAVALGVNEIDTSPYYGNSEEMIGNYQRLNPQLKICTKIGIPRLSENFLLPSEIKKQFNSSINKLQVDKIETLFFHSVPNNLLSRSIIETAESFKLDNFISNLGYSGDNENLKLALRINAFDSYMVTVNALDVADYHQIKDIQGKNLYIKRPLANAVFKFTFQMLAKSKIRKAINKEFAFNLNSYPGRYRRIFGEPSKHNNDIFKFIQFLVYLQPNAKYVFGVSSKAHLSEIIKTYKLVKSQVTPELNHYLEMITDLTVEYNWRALS
jgi:aryl-alcohol dehydrogenase-like predicted oxidoreductase